MDKDSKHLSANLHPLLCWIRLIFSRRLRQMQLSFWGLSPTLYW